MPLEEEFTNEMYNVVENVKSECKYDAIRLQKMIDNHGGLKTAKRLLKSNINSDGFIVLFEKGRLDLSVENVILKEKWEPLFTNEERRNARNKLIRCNFNLDNNLDLST